MFELWYFHEIMNIFNLFIKQRNLGIRLYTDKKEKKNLPHI
jgi:hypothetical protein